jgi:hypothetical protein
MISLMLSGVRSDRRLSMPGIVETSSQVKRTWMTDFRDLRTELEHAAQELELAENALLCSSFHSSAIRAKAAAHRARAALAQPEPVAPTDEEIEKWADAATEVPLEEMDPEVHGWRRCFTAKEFGETIRAAIAYWGTPANNTRGTQYDG